MRTGLKLAAFAAVLALVGGLAAVAGGAIDPGRIGGDEMATDGHGSEEMTTMSDEHEGGHEEMPGGLAIAEAGYRLELSSPAPTAGERGALSFRIVGPDGEAVTDFEEEHGKRLHLIVVRRDLSGFQHLHPEMAPDGTWSVPLTLPEAGPYRVYADFVTAGEGLTLGADLTAPGDYRPRALPAPADTARVAGYEVHKGVSEDGSLEFRVTRDGRPVDDLQPYLGARGHLVVIREGDLAYLHVHPEESEAGNAIGFHADLRTPGRYRMFLQFRHDGEVRTAAFTEEVAR
jgi:hypothetical protein